jgi:hypothetical protein
MNPGPSEHKTGVILGHYLLYNVYRMNKEYSDFCNSVTPPVRIDPLFTFQRISKITEKMKNGLILY